MPQESSYQPAEDDLLDRDAIIMLTHLRMHGYSMRSALLYMRSELQPRVVNGFLAKKFKKVERVFTVFGGIVHEKRKSGELPEVPTPQKAPVKNQPFYFRRR